MKTIKLCSLALITVILVSLTSCLGDSENTQDVQFVSGIVVSEKGKKLIQTQVLGNIYDPRISTMYFGTGDEYVVCSFQVETTSAENANAEENGYWHVTLYDDPATVNEGGVDYYNKPDTTVLLANEIELSEGVIATYPYSNIIAYINGMFFLPTGNTGLTGQEAQFVMYIDPAQEPIKNGSINEYTAILRAVETAAGKTPQLNHLRANAYNLKYPIETIQQKEKQLGNERFNLRFTFLSKIEEKEGEEVELTWTKDATAIPFGVPKD
ncbi:hypothetical protein [Parabacteroides sp. PF5-9]|uniref:hypothetical protein n=1 Tax=Parabacteroides sp. PF5-9 TaxID=1742404 RepID=UPI0024738EB3|nr:hypothetical protein [Parabacteroides sp. PF5-9]MDH6357178.1 hypothetical protein [Parabacteroides sp. PF5-9]